MEQRTVERRKEAKRMKNCVDVEPNRAHDIAAGTLNLSFLFGVLWWILWNFIYNVKGWGAVYGWRWLVEVLKCLYF